MIQILRKQTSHEEDGSIKIKKSAVNTAVELKWFGAGNNGNWKVGRGEEEVRSRRIKKWLRQDVYNQSNHSEKRNI